MTRLIYYAFGVLHGFFIAGNLGEYTKTGAGKHLWHLGMWAVIGIVFTWMAYRDGRDRD